MRSSECFDFMVLVLFYKTQKFSVLILLPITTPLLTGHCHFFFFWLIFLSAEEAMCFLDCPFKFMPVPLHWAF